MKRILLLILCCFSSIAFAQQQTIDLPEARFKLGLNLGGSWQNSDVRAKAGSGVGITLEYAVLQNSRSPIGVSLRGRYLYTQTYGQDLKASTSGFLYNNAVNGVNNPASNYLTSGVVYHNFKTSSNNLDLELMLTANRLRRHGLILYVFGGIGAMGYNSYVDKLDISGGMYDYASIGNSIFSVKEDLRLKQDGDYETRADNLRRPHWVFAPSLGAAFGIRFSPVFSLIFEHKITFPKTDLLDGQRWTANNNPTVGNDIHHYANLGMRFGIGGGGGRGRIRGENNNNTHITNPPPVISIVEPTSYPATAPNCRAELIFRVSNITSKENVEIRFNGNVLPSSEYTMDVVTKQFSLTKKINGESLFQIRAYNGYGEDNETVQFGCSPTLYPPVITLVEPGTPVITNCQANFKVSVTNIKSKDQIEIRQNGAVVNSSLYSFDASSGYVSLYSVTLTGKAVFTIKATNTVGTSSLQITFNCSNTPIVQAPGVEIISPSGNPYISTTCSEPITAQLYNIKATDRIQVLIDNVALRPTQYTYNANTGILTFRIVIRDRSNIVINVSNATGRATTQTQILCRPAPPVVSPPTINITLPVVTPFISATCNERIVAYATNIADKSGIQIFVNDALLSPSQFTYNNATGEIALTLKLEADAAIRFVATNSAGQASDNAVLRCQPSVPNTPKPTVTVTTPYTDPYTSVKCSEVIIAETRHVSRKQDISVYVNGVLISPSEFSFDPAAQRIQLTRTIAQRSTIQFIVSNAGGSAVDQVEIICQPPVINNPTVSITQPGYNVSVNPNCTEHIVAITSNVNSKNQISINLNGRTLNAQDFIFDVASQKIEFNMLVVNPTNIKITVSNGTVSVSDQKTMTCSPTPVVLPPTVSITSPGSETFTSVTCRERITAQVNNVSSKSEIEIWVGTRKLTNTEFTLSADNRSVSFDATLNTGNDVRIRVTNTAGTAEDRVVITCVYPPVVTITTPVGESYTSTDCRELIVAGITNIVSKSQTAVYVNGQRLDASLYEYNSVSHTLSMNHIFSGTSTVKIEATNEAGSSNDVIVMNCKPVEPVKPLPVISLLNPVSGTASQQVCTGNCLFEIKAKIENVNDATMCIVTVNGQVVSPNQYSFITSTGLFGMNRKPATGKNEVIIIEARNANGTAKQEINLSCSNLASPASINITTPAAPELSSQTCEQKVVAKVNNITSENIRVYANGIQLSAGQYNWNAAAKEINITINVSNTSVVKIEGTNECGKASDEVTFRCLPPSPTVVITAPGTTPYTSVECQESVRATVTNVTGKEQIVVRINGQTMSDDVYSYNPSTDVLDLITKVESNTTVEIIATNESGSTSDKVVMNCKPRPGIPTVTITSPSTTPYTSVNCQETVHATVLNVTGKEQITVKANGQTIPDEQYNYNASTHTVELTVRVEANTTIEITATNESGTATDNVVMNCKPKVNPPTVTIINPSNPYTSPTCSETITAIETNITGVEQVVVKINGQVLGLDLYTYNPSTHRIVLATTIEGTTTVEFIVTNEAGSATDKVVIYCKPRPGVPAVTITNPASTPYASVNCQENVKATVLNVSGKSQIEVKANGQTIADEQYNYNASTHTVELTVRVETNTAIEIIATNESGSASDKVVMNCKPSVNVPTVTITTPSSTPYTSVNCQETVRATVMHVNGKEQITVKANGQAIGDEQYNYNTSTHIVELTVRVATNTSIEIIATNEAGTASDKVVMNCKPDIEIPTFPENNTCPTTSPAKYVDCETCHSSETGTTSLSVDAGKKVCIQNSFKGQITMNGGMLVICGTAVPTSLNFNSGTIVINGEAVFGSLNLNNSTCTVRNFGKLTVGGTTYNGRIENYGTMTVNSDCNVNTNGVFKNTGVITIKGSMNNGNDVCNSGTMNITGSLHNNNGATFVNSCKVIVSNEFHNNSNFENTGYVRSINKTVINGGSTFRMGGGSRLVAGSLDFNGTISGISNQCAVVSVSGQTIVNGAARLTGNATLCDANGIEQNNSGGAITSNCTCIIPASTCIPNDGVVTHTEEPEKKVRICHKPPGNPENCHTLEVGESAVKAHLAHGDHLGECTEGECSTPNSQKEKEDAERKQREEQQRQEAEKKQKEEHERLETEKKQREEQQRLDAEKKQREEQQRLEAEKKQKEEHERLETEKKQREEQQRLDAEKKQHEEQQRLEAEKKQREEQQRLDAEKKQREEQQRLEAEKKQHEEQQRLDAEKKQKEEQERIEREKKEKESQEGEKKEGN